MQLEEAKNKFIQSWGTLGTHWGINRTMAQILALLLVSDKPLSANDIMAQLNISMGNTNMNIRALMDWSLVYKELVPGERKDFYIAEKDVWKVTSRIVEHRKRKELEPMIRILEDLQNVEGEGESVEEFKEVVNQIHLFAVKSDATLEKILIADRNNFFNILMKLVLK